MNNPALTTDQMREVDRLMVETYQISLLQMMENAGRSLAELARCWLGGDVVSRTIIVLIGPGNNGGGGMVAARHLHNWGAEVRVVLAAEPARLKQVPAQQWASLQALGMERSEIDVQPASLILDALLGYGATGGRGSPVAEWIRWANRQPAPILSMDVPSGLDATSGADDDPTIIAAATLTLALPKTGLLVPEARKFVGKLYLADIGVPPELYAGASLGLKVDALFSKRSIVRLGRIYQNGEVRKRALAAS